MSQTEMDVTIDRSNAPSNDESTESDDTPPSEHTDQSDVLRTASEQNANKASVHRDEDGNVLAVSIVLSPMQVALHGLPDGIDTVCPVVDANSITLVPADYTR